jgi:hypothetical protein
LYRWEFTGTARVNHHFSFSKKNSTNPFMFICFHTKSSLEPESVRKKNFTTVSIWRTESSLSVILQTPVFPDRAGFQASNKKKMQKKVNKSVCCTEKTSDKRNSCCRPFDTGTRNTTT